jgi:hypothetical protein
MPPGCFNAFFVVGMILLPFALYALYWRWRLSGTLITQEDYRWLPNGDLKADRGVFQLESRQVTLNQHDGPRTLPFEQIRGVSIEVRTSRKIHLGLLVVGQEEAIPLSIVTNHDLKRAGVNAHLVAQAVAQAGDAYLLAFREHRWPRQLLGATFHYEWQ